MLTSRTEVWGYLKAELFLFIGFIYWNIYLWLFGPLWEQTSPEWTVHQFSSVCLSGFHVLSALSPHMLSPRDPVVFLKLEPHGLD